MQAAVLDALALTGAFAASVNHPETLPHLTRLVADAVAALGIGGAQFDTVTVHRHDNALVFDAPEPLVRYAVAALSFHGVGPDAPERAAVAHEIDARARAWFACADGPWRDPKGYTVCIGTNSSR